MYDSEDSLGFEENDPCEEEVIDTGHMHNILTRAESFHVWTTNDIESRQNKIIEETTELLGLPPDDAIIVLRYYKWNQDKLNEHWFDKMKDIKKKSGLAAEEGLVSFDMVKSDFCYICYSPIKSKQEGDSLRCNHQFCRVCWEEYLAGRVVDGMKCLSSTCPYYNCPVMVTHSMFANYLTGKSLSEYRKFHCKSYTDDNKRVRWCPRPGCEFCVEQESFSGHEVKCRCGHSFCFKCNRDSHRPCDCDMQEKWMSKNNCESENVTWILANTKQCPGCRRPIEKNQGCNHMTCRQCNYEFCWLCMGDWKEHGSATGGYYACNKYEDLKKTDKILKEQEDKRYQAKTDLDRYMFYFERFNGHDRSQKHAEGMRHQIQKQVEKLHKEKQYPIAELEFLFEGLEEVIRCRKILKWTYCYGYYLEPGKEKNLFEYLQEHLEKNCDHLHELIERDFSPFYDKECTEKTEFYMFKGDLVNYFQVTRKFYTNLLEGIDNGLTA